MARDIIISAFATPSDYTLGSAGLGFLEPSDVQPLGLFRDKPLLIGVDKASNPATGEAAPEWGGQGFRWAAERFRAAGGGSVLQGLLQRYAAGVTPRRIALIGFSAGNSFVSSVLRVKEDAELVDTVLSLDGMTYGMNNGVYVPASFTEWVGFAERATGVLQHRSGVSNPYLSPLLVNAHTHIVSNAPLMASSTNQAAEKLLSIVNADYWAHATAVPQGVKNDQARRQNDIKSRLKASLSKMVPVTVSCGGKKSYSSLWPEQIGYLGNYWTLDFGGQVGADHCMIAFLAQRALFDAFLIPRWNSRNEAVAGSVALGQVEWTSPDPSTPGGGLIERGTFRVGIGPKQVGIGVALSALVAAGIILAPERAR